MALWRGGGSCSCLQPVSILAVDDRDESKCSRVHMAVGVRRGRARVTAPLCITAVSSSTPTLPSTKSFTCARRHNVRSCPTTSQST